MGPTSAKLGPEMEDRNGQNSIQTAGAFDAANARNCAETNAIGARERSRRSAEEAHPPGACALRFGHRCTQWQAQRPVYLGGDEGNRMRGKLPGNGLDPLTIGAVIGRPRR